MKINWKKCVELKDLKFGTAFVYDNNLYIKIDLYDEDTASNQLMYAVNLETGIAESFFTDKIVTPIKAEITVDGN